MPVRYRWDDFVLDLDAYRLERDGRPLSLEPKAFNLLALMIRRPGHLFTKQEIFEAVWPDTAVTDHALTRVVAQLRRVLGDDVRDAKYLETVPTRGYRWIRPVEPESEFEGGAPGGASLRPPAARPRAEVSPTKRPLLLLIAACVAVLAAASVIWARFESAAGRPESTKTLTLPQLPAQVTTHTGLDLNPALSMRDDALAFASDRSGAFEIYVRDNVAGSNEIAVTNDGGNNVQPAWSPDGRHIAYHSASRGGVWVVPARGGTPRQLVSQGSHPEWSPDGQRIAYQSDEHPDIAPTGFAAHVGSTLWVIDAAGGTPRQLTQRGNPQGGHAAPAWSRNGDYIAFSVYDGGPDDGLWVIRENNGVVTPISRGSRVYEPVFATDDRSIYAAAGEPLIVRYPFDASTGQSSAPFESIALPGVAGARGLSLSADGQDLVFAGVALSSHIWAQPINQPPGRPAEPFALTRDTSRRNYAPAISPDGSSVAYGSARRGEFANIWLMPLESRQPVQLTDYDGFDGNPSWFPDGRRLAYLSDRPGESGLRSIDIVTRQETALPEIAPERFAEAKTRERLAEVQMSPSGRRTALIVATRPYGFRRVYVADATQAAPVALTDGNVSVGYPVWSRDERQLAVEIQEGGLTQLGVIDLATGRLRKLTNERGQVWVRSWSPDGRRLASAVLRGRQWSLEWYDVSNGEHGTLLEPGPPNVYYRYPEWSPKGDLIVFERGQVNGNIWRVKLTARGN